jgi:hypothetical protein
MSYDHVKYALGQRMAIGCCNVIFLYPYTRYFEFAWNLCLIKHRATKVYVAVDVDVDRELESVERFPWYYCVGLLPIIQSV